MLTLRNWSVTNRGILLLDPEILSSQLQGYVYGHPRFEDGASVITSRIVNITDKCDYKEVKTYSGSVYRLYELDVDLEYEKRFPSAYNRLKLERPE